ncbi:MAG TPA: hypothetical protein VGO89_02485 [Streptomyces sp.]|nr:hypothetical protein [Streptomyces sp.]
MSRADTSLPAALDVRLGNSASQRRWQTALRGTREFLRWGRGGQLSLSETANHG